MYYEQDASREESIFKGRNRNEASILIQVCPIQICLDTGKKIEDSQISPLAFTRLI